MMKDPIDIADSEFTFYNEEQWAVALAEWRAGLKEYGDSVNHWDDYDIVKMVWGEGVFIMKTMQRDSTNHILILDRLPK